MRSRPLAVVLLGVMAACDPGPSLEYGPCVPGRVGHVRSFGYYAGGAYLSELSGYSNLSWGGGTSTLASAHAAGMRAVLDVQGVFQVASTPPPSDAEIAARWAAFVPQLQPDLAALAALYVADEPYMNGERAGVAPDEVQRRLESAARRIHATAGFEGVPVATIFSDRGLDILESGAAGMPAGYSWVGWDLYAVGVDQIQDRVDRFLQFVRPDQRVIAVPDAFIWNRELGNTASSLRALDRLEARIAFWLAWIEDHPQVITVTPFIYQSGALMTGARDLPPIRARWEQIGACIVQASTAQ